MRHVVMSIIGGWRLWRGYCPECNLDAPELYECPVCQYYSGRWPPSEDTKQAWWNRWKLKHGL